MQVLLVRFLLMLDLEITLITIVQKDNKNDLFFLFNNNLAVNTHGVRNVLIIAGIVLTIVFLLYKS